MWSIDIYLSGNPALISLMQTLHSLFFIVYNKLILKLQQLFYGIAETALLLPVVILLPVRAITAKLGNSKSLQNITIFVA